MGSYVAMPPRERMRVEARRDAKGSRSQQREMSATPVQALARSTPATEVIKGIRLLPRPSNWPPPAAPDFAGISVCA